MLIFNTTDDWHDKQQLYEQAEGVYVSIRQIHPKGAFPGVDRKLAAAAGQLEIMAENQAKGSPNLAGGSG